MKMGAGIIWGTILIIIGLGIVIRVVFNIDFPVFKFLFALFFIFIGIRMMVGSFGLVNLNFKKNDIVFGEKHIKGNPVEDEYNVIFGKGVFDFRDVNLSEGTVKVKVSTIFGGTEILINPETPVKIKADAVFAGAELPEGNTAVFGTSYYTSANFLESEPHLYIKVDVVFGGVEVKKR